MNTGRSGESQLLRLICRPIVTDYTPAENRMQEEEMSLNKFK